MNKINSFIFSFIQALAILLSANALAVEVPAQNQILIYAHEADDELELNPVSSLQNVLEQFHLKGGTVIRLAGDTPPFSFHDGDIVFPACSGGNNRSQTLWNVLRAYNDRITVMLPHATRYGFDPYNGLSNWPRTNHVQKDDEFIFWAGVYKSQKFGWDVFGEWLAKPEGTAEELDGMWHYYNQNYYNPDILEGARRIYITFAKNAHIHLYRLTQTNTSLENVVVLFFPLEDLIKKPLPEWDTYPRSIKAYTELARLLTRHLDFSLVE